MIDDEVVALFAGLWGLYPASLLHGAEHVDRLVDGEDALGVAGADSALAAAELDGHSAEGERSLVAHVPVEAVYHLAGVDIGTLRVYRHRDAVVLDNEGRKLHVLGDDLRAPVRPDVGVIVVPLQVLAGDRGRVVGAGLLGHLAGEGLIAAERPLTSTSVPGPILATSEALE